MVRKQEMNEERKVLMELALMGELILDQCRLKLKENQDADLITEVAVLKVNEANGIRERYRAIFEIPENPSEIELRKKQKLKMDGKLRGEFKK